MSDLHEPSYLEGQRAAWRSVLSIVLRELDVESGDPAVAISRLVKEREDTIAQLRHVCRDLGLDWPDDLYVADIVEKRIAPGIEELRRNDYHVPGDLRDAVEVLQRHVSACPLGWHDGKAIAGRSTTNADVVTWLQELKRLTLDAFRKSDPLHRASIPRPAGDAR